MTRLFLLVLCSGCDLVIPLTEPTSAVCGPYTSITPVPFSDFLAEPRDFSVSYDPNVGMVFAKIQINTTTTFTGPIPIRLDVDGLWKPDRTKDINMLWKDATGGHILSDGSMFLWRDRTSQLAPSMVRFEFTNAWTQSTSEGVIDNDLSRNFRPGNEIVLPIDNGTLRFYAVVKVDANGTEKNKIQVRQKFADEGWVDTAQASLINARDDISASAAVLTLKHDIIVYAASVNGEKSRIYAALRDKNEDKFQIGSLVDLDSQSDLDDTEPWIAEDCKTLYFRRGGITYRAQ